MLNLIFLFNLSKFTNNTEIIKDQEIKHKNMEAILKLYVLIILLLWNLII